MKKIRVIIYLWILFCLMVFGVFTIKAPSKDILVGSNFEDANYLKLKTGHIYEQPAIVKDSTITKLLFVLDRVGKNHKNVSGKLLVKIYDKNHQEFMQQEYDINSLPTDQTTISIDLANRQKKGEKYYLEFQLIDAKNSDLTLLSVNDGSKYSDNGEKQKRSIAYYHDSKVVDKTCFWYPVYGIAFGIFLLLISGDKKNEK